MNKKVIILVIIIILAAAVGYFYFNSHAKLGRNFQKVEVKPQIKLDKVPLAVDEIFDFSHSDVHPYNILEASFPDGSVQYSLSYNTASLRENYSIFKTDLVSNKKFTLQADTIDDKNNFTLSFAKDSQQASVTGKAGLFKNPSEGMITIHVYVKHN